MNSKKIVLTVLAAALVVALSGCDDKKEETAAVPAAPVTAPAPAEKPATTPAPSTEQAAPTRDPDEVISEKMHVYIGCYNKLDASIHRSMERYGSWLKNFEAGPTGKESIVYGLYSVSDTSECEKDIAEASQLQPGLPAIDTIAVNYIHSASVFVDQINALDKYYEQEDYKDDAFKKAKEAHAPLLSAWKNFKPLSEEFQAAISKVNDERQLARLNEIDKREGKSSNYHVLAIMINAKSLNQIIEQKEFPADIAMSIVAELQISIDALNKKENVPAGNSVDVSGFARDAENYQLAAKQRIRRIRDKVPYSDGDKMFLDDSTSAAMVEGTAEKVFREYNSLVADFNRMR